MENTWYKYLVQKIHLFGVGTPIPGGSGIFAFTTIFLSFYNYFFQNRFLFSAFHDSDKPALPTKLKT
jgi:hypothetical protein